MKNNTNVSPATKPDYDFKKDVVKTYICNDLKVSKDSVPTWSSDEMNETDFKSSNKSKDSYSE